MGGAAVWDECGSRFAVIDGEDFVVDNRDGRGEYGKADSFGLPLR